MTRYTIRNFVRKSLDNQKKLIIILAAVSVISGVLAAGTQLLFGKSSVYRDEFYIAIDPNLSRPEVNINTAGIPVTVGVWDGEDIKVECIDELPLIVDISEAFEQEITISQDDSFAVSLFTFDLFRYNLKVFLPASVDYRAIKVDTNSGDIEINLPGHMLPILETYSVRGVINIY